MVTQGVRTSTSEELTKELRMRSNKKIDKGSRIRPMRR
jgi:hypothetical protein